MRFFMVVSFMIIVFCRYLTGMVDKRTLEKYEREAKEKNRETW
jgi:translation elongation factor EF-1alpha